MARTFTEHFFAHTRPTAYLRRCVHTTSYHMDPLFHVNCLENEQHEQVALSNMSARKKHAVEYIGANHEDCYECNHTLHCPCCFNAKYTSFLWSLPPAQEQDTLAFCTRPPEIQLPARPPARPSVRSSSVRPSVRPPIRFVLFFNYKIKF